tara:strand:+ start:411 stop:692 length:282 start_codon:yes stop_codon:yes gene_type:complete
MDVQKEISLRNAIRYCIENNDANTATNRIMEFIRDEKAAINYTHCSTQLPTEDEILSESNSRQLEGAEPYSFAGGARWALSSIKQIPKTQKED